MSTLHDRVVARLRADPSRWFTSNSLAAELGSSPDADGGDDAEPEPSARPTRQAVRSTLESLARAGVVEREGSTFRWQGGESVDEGQSADGTSSQ